MSAVSSSVSQSLSALESYVHGLVEHVMVPARVQQAPPIDFSLPPFHPSLNILIPDLFPVTSDFLISYRLPVTCARPPLLVNKMQTNLSHLGLQTGLHFVDRAGKSNSLSDFLSHPSTLFQTYCF